MPSHILAGADHQANLDLHGWGFSKFRRLQIAAVSPPGHQLVFQIETSVELGCFV